jgi:predicted ATPase
MDKLILKNVRCFASPDPVPIAPLTLLVGENSSGKSTFLAAVRLASQLVSNDFGAIDFNEEPFLWGTFDQIATNRGQGAQRPSEFVVGFEVGLHNQGSDAASLVPTRVQARFVNQKSEPFLRQLTVHASEHDLIVDRRSSPQSLRATLSGSHGSDPVLRRDGEEADLGEIIIALRYFHLVRRPGEKRPARSNSASTLQDTLVMARLLSSLRKEMGQIPYAFGPVRSRPKPSYDPTKDSPRPSGGHIPMVLAKIYGGEGWKAISNSLELFGRVSGLFDGVIVKNSGGLEEGNPFQILIKTGSSTVNLAHVGYGVSQILPVVVELIRGKKGQTFLIQQPEVHLHPQAQAELGTLFGLLVKSQKKRFFVETHSDYLVDRVRMDIRDKKHLRPEDVQILYFERTPKGVQIHPIQIDAMGNLLNVPHGYRAFFLKETNRFLGV